MNAYKADVAATFDGAALRARARSCDSARSTAFTTSSLSPAPSRDWQQDEAAACRASSTSRCAMPPGRRTRRRQRRAPRRRAVPRAAQARLHAARARRDRRASRRRRRVQLAGDHSAAARRLRADRSRHRSRRRARPGALLHLVPRAGQGFVLQGLARKEAGRRRTLATAIRSRRAVVRRARSPAARSRRSISEFHKLRAEGWPLGALAMICVDNPMAAAHRPPHLQRLHEVVHLPEAGSGRHSAGGNAHAEGRARAAVGLRDLFAADALESAQPAPARAAACDAASACSSSAWARRASRSRTTC